MKLTLFLCLATFAYKSNAQKTSAAPIKKRDAIITYEYKLFENGKEVSMVDTLFTRGSMVLEPIKIEIQPSDAAASSNTTNAPLAKKLEAYYLTDLSKMAGMKFRVGDKPSAANIITYTANEKGAGYHLIPEPINDSTLSEFQKFVKTKDTVINGDMCVEFEYNKPIQATFIKSKRTIVSRKILINTTLKDQQYSFISPAIPAHFGGAIMIFETKDDTGMVTQVKYNYITNIPPAYKQLFDKYEGLFNANLNLLDSGKK